MSAEIRIHACIACKAICHLMVMTCMLIATYNLEIRKSIRLLFAFINHLPIMPALIITTIIIIIIIIIINIYVYLEWLLPIECEIPTKFQQKLGRFVII